VLHYVVDMYPPRTRLVWGEKELIMYGQVVSVKKHPVLPIIVALSFRYAQYFHIVVWDGHQKFQSFRFEGYVLAPLSVEGNAVRFYSAPSRHCHSECHSQYII